MRVLGIDMSTSHSGWALLERDGARFATRGLGWATETKSATAPARQLERELGMTVRGRCIALPPEIRRMPQDAWQTCRMARHRAALDEEAFTALRPDVVVIEGFAFAAKEMQRGSFDTGGSHWIVRMLAYHYGARIRVHDPSSLKMHATGQGNADKAAMVAAAQTKGLLPEAFAAASSSSSWGKVVEDVADALWLAHLGAVEVLVRRGELDLRNLEEGTRRVFLRTTKAYPVNLLDRPFVEAEAGGLL